MKWSRKNTNHENPNNPVSFELSRLAHDNRLFLAIGMLLAAAIAIFGGLRGPQAPLPLLEETEFSLVDLSGNTHRFAYADAQRIELRSDFQHFDRGEKLDGVENRRYYSGTYQNREFGTYQLHAAANLDAYIVVHLPEGVLVLSYESDETTQMLYQSFTEDSGDP